MVKNNDTGAVSSSRKKKLASRWVLLMAAAIKAEGLSLFWDNDRMMDTHQRANHIDRTNNQLLAHQDKTGGNTNKRYERENFIRHRQ